MSVDYTHPTTGLKPAPTRLVHVDAQFEDRSRPGRVITITGANEGLWNYEVATHPAKPDQVGTVGRIRTEQLRTRFRKITTQKETA